MKKNIISLIIIIIITLGKTSSAQNIWENRSKEIINRFDRLSELYFIPEKSSAKKIETSKQASAEQWVNIGPNSPSSKFRLHIDKQRNYIYVASVEGFWYSPINNISWTQREDVGWIGRTVWSLSTHPNFDGRIVTGRENAFFKGYIDVTNNWGVTFQHLYNSQGGAVNDVKFVPLSPNIFYACTWSDIADGELLKSTDGGMSFSLIPNSIHHAKTEIAPDNINSNIVYVSGSSGIIKTTDGGANWFNSSNGIPPDRGVYCMGMNPQFTNLIVCSTDSGLHKTTNGGANWFYVSHNYVVRHFAVNPANSNVIAGVTFDPYYVIISSDGGNTWQQFSPALNVAYKYDIAFSPDGTKLYVVASENGVYMIDVTNYVPVEFTSFTGRYLIDAVELNWSTASEKNNFGFEILRSFQNGEYEKIGFAEGSGTTTEQKNYSFTDDLKNILALTHNLNLSITYKLKQIDFDGTENFSKEIVVEINDESMPKEFVLHQNYPNPFNPITKIKFTIPALTQNESVMLKVYDILGREVATLINAELSPREYEVVFNIYDELSTMNYELNSNIYFYRLTAGNFTATKKFILLK